MLLSINSYSNKAEIVYNWGICKHVSSNCYIASFSASHYEGYHNNLKNITIFRKIYQLQPIVQELIQKLVKSGLDGLSVPRYLGHYKNSKFINYG